MSLHRHSTGSCEDKKESSKCWGMSTGTCDSGSPGSTPTLKKRSGRKAKKKVDTQPTTPPDPCNFNILAIHAQGGYAALLIEYPDCTNYEGRKILVYEGRSLTELTNATKLDPHFCGHKECLSPLARFRPTDLGWKLAVELVDQLAKD